jgi:putative phage-type endonuclease
MVIQTKDRNKTIGGSDVACILGISPFKTKHALLLEKKGIKQPIFSNEQLEIMESGNLMEPYIIEICKNKFFPFSNIEMPNDTIFSHAEYPFLTGHFDGIMDGHVLVEVKNVDIKQFDKWEIDGVPDYYISQVQHYMMVFPQLTSCVFFVCFSGKKFRYYTVAKDEAYIEDMLVQELDFWQLMQAPYEEKIQNSNTDDNIIIADEYLANLLTEIKELKIKKENKVEQWEFEIQQRENIVKTMYLDDISKKADFINANGEKIGKWIVVKGATRFDATKAKQMLTKEQLDQCQKKSEGYGRFSL